MGAGELLAEVLGKADGMKPQVVFIVDKYCDANPSKGIPSGVHHHLKGTLESLNAVDLHMIWYDELLAAGSHADIALDAWCAEHKVDVILNAHLLSHLHYCVTEPALRRAQARGAKIVCQWFDFICPVMRQRVQKEFSWADLHIVYDVDENYGPHGDNFLWGWGPMDRRLYFPIPEERKDIDLSFVGAFCDGNRKDYWQAATSIPRIVMVASGGQRTPTVLTDFEYADVIKRSRMSVNFSWSGPNGFQLKARPFEITSNGTMLLDNAGSHTGRFFKEGVEFVAFTSKVDFAAKVKYYRGHPAERIAIAQAGHQKYLNNWTDAHFWGKVFKWLGYDIGVSA